MIARNTILIFTLSLTLILALTGLVMADSSQAEAGSSFSGSVASVTTNLNAGFIGTDSSSPVTLNYAVSAKGITLSDGTYMPMNGDISSFFNVHTMSGFNSFGAPSSILDYSDFSSASGLINAFSKSYSYNSGVAMV